MSSPNLSSTRAGAQIVIAIEIEMSEKSLGNGKRESAAKTHTQMWKHQITITQTANDQSVNHHEVMISDETQIQFI